MKNKDLNFSKQIQAYFTGFILSLALTFLAYFLTIFHLSSGHEFIGHEIAITLLIIFAMVQLAVQMYYFLHLGHPKNREQLFFFAATFLIVLMVILGTLWIMQNLNHNMMPKQMEEYILWKEGIHK